MTTIDTSALCNDERYVYRLAITVTLAHVSDRCCRSIQDDFVLVHGKQGIIKRRGMAAGCQTAARHNTPRRPHPSADVFN